MFQNGKMVFDVIFTDRDEAEKYCLGAYSGTAEVVGVYRQPQPVLADEDREAIKAGILLCEGLAGEANENANANAWAKTAGRLRGLLERFG
jgi:hypothetical protein